MGLGAVRFLPFPCWHSPEQVLSTNRRALLGSASENHHLTRFLIDLTNLKASLWPDREILLAASRLASGHM